MSEDNSRYRRTTQSGQWIQDNGVYAYKLETDYFEFDLVLRDWVKTRTETKYQTPEEYGYKKEIQFCIVFPDPDATQPRKFGKNKKAEPKLLLQVGTVKVRPEAKNCYLMKQTQRAIEQQGATNSNRIYVKTLDNGGICYRMEYQSDERIICSIGDPIETNLAALKKLEEKGTLIMYHGKVLYSESEGYQYASVALNKNL